MAQRFRGGGLHKVDNKGRVSIPHQFRGVIQACDPQWTEGLAPRLVLVYGPPSQKYIEGFSMEAAHKVDMDIEALPRSSRSRKLMQRFYNTESTEIAIDDTGRLVIPQAARLRFDLTDEARFVATADTFQIWNPQAYDDDMAALTREVEEDLPDDFNLYELLDNPDVLAGGSKVRS